MVLSGARAVQLAVAGIVFAFLSPAASSSFPRLVYSYGLAHRHRRQAYDKQAPGLAIAWLVAAGGLAYTQGTHSI